jgi:hypothetical protein
MRTLWKRILILVLVLLLMVSAGFVGWASFPLGPGDAALAAMQSDDAVSVETVQGWTVFSPVDGTPQTGFIFYPGGRVDYRSYAPLLKPLAEQGFLVVLVPMPLSMAFFAPEKADGVTEAFPGISDWAIGGHSLGGAMAARYVYNHPGEMQALALWASYPASTDSLTGRDLAVLSIYGTEDGKVEELENSFALLPDGTTWVIIEGGNHAQFGDYGLQPGDGTAKISSEAQWQAVVTATAVWLNALSEN